MTIMTSVRNPLLTGIPLAVERKVTVPEGFTLPLGTRVISADNHWDIAEDVYFDRLPEELKKDAPRIWVDKFTYVGFADEQGELKSPLSGGILQRISNRLEGRNHRVSRHRRRPQGHRLRRSGTQRH